MGPTTAELGRKVAPQPSQAKKALAPPRTLAGGLTHRPAAASPGRGYTGLASCRPQGWSLPAPAPWWRHLRLGYPDLNAAMASGEAASRPGGPGRRTQQPVKDTDSRLGEGGLKQDKSESGSSTSVWAGLPCKAKWTDRLGRVRQTLVSL